MGSLRPRVPQFIGNEPPIPSDRFFATSQSLEESRPWIEAGVMLHLRAIYDYAGEPLDAGMVLVVYPRAYQYSDRESPESWERWGPSCASPFATSRKPGTGCRIRS